MNSVHPLTTLDSVIASLQRLRDQFDDGSAGAPQHEAFGRYINAPVWPWVRAGTLVGALIVLIFAVAWLEAGG
jgi:hypothetical protein